MAEVKYDSYKFTDEADLTTTLDESGYSYETPLPANGIFTDEETGETLDYTYFKTIVTNYPNTGGEWTPVYSTEVYINSARKGNIKLPSDKKLTGNERKYFNEYINKFYGEPDIT